MFETATLSYGPPSKRVWTTAMGFTGQAMVIACAVVAPMIWPQTLGRAVLVTALVNPGVPPGPAKPAPPDTRVVPRPSHAVATRVFKGIVAPAVVPTQVAKVVDIGIEPEFTAGGNDTGPGVVGGGDRNGGGGGGGNIIDLVTRIERVTPVVVAHREVKPPEPPKPARITSLRMATPIRKVDPVYPVLAVQAHISGTVELLGVLGTDGRIHELRVMRGHPLLVGAAIEAVRQWVFEPTVLNGQAVEVSAPITVNFILNR